MIHERANYGFRTPPKGLVQNGDTLDNWELRQKLPGTKLFDGIDDLSFINGGCLINVRINPKWKFDDRGNYNFGEVDYSYLDKLEAEQKEEQEKAAIQEAIVNKYAAEVDKQISDLAVKDIVAENLEASILSAMIAAKEIKP